MPKITWNDAAVAKLCSAILATADVKLDYQKIADIMGPDATKKGVELQIGKMRRSLKASDLSSPAQLSNGTKTPKNNGKRKPTKDADVGDSLDVEDTPSKPAKKTKTKLAEIPIYDDGEEDIEGVKDGVDDDDGAI